MHAGRTIIVTKWRNSVATSKKHKNILKSRSTGNIWTGNIWTGNIRTFGKNGIWEHYDFKNQNVHVFLKYNDTYMYYTYDKHTPSRCWRYCIHSIISASSVFLWFDPLGEYSGSNMSWMRSPVTFVSDGANIVQSMSGYFSSKVENFWIHVLRPRRSCSSSAKLANIE